MKKLNKSQMQTIKGSFDGKGADAATEGVV